MALNFLLKRSGTASKRPTAANMALGELDLNYDAATGGLYYKDSNGNVVKVGPTQVSATAPNVSPAGSAGNSAGECWFDTANQVLKVWTGSSWVDATSTNGFLPLTGGTMTGDITFSGTQSIPVSGIDGASTTQPGVVQLNDTTSSTSTTEALTANQGKELQDQINALSVASNITLAGTIDASTGDLVTVTTEGTAAGFTVGDPLPSASSGNDNFFVIVTTPGTMTPPGGVSQECHQGDWWLSDGAGWVFLDVGFNATAATTSTPGVVQLATDAEVQAGLNSDHAVTSSGLQSKVSDSTSTTSSTALASSTAVKSAYDAGIQGQTDAAAALAAANAAGTDVGTLASLTTTDKTSAVAAINEVNAAASAAQGDATQAISDASAAQATADAAVPRASYTAKGDLLSGTGSGIFVTLSPGSNGQVLYACSTAASGLCWANAPTTPAATPSTLGTVFGCIVTTGPFYNSSYGYCANNGNGGAFNTAIGYQAMAAASSGTNNTAVGHQAGCALTSGLCNVMLGTLAGRSVVSSTGVTAIGRIALCAATGSSNTGLGNNVGNLLTTGSNNTLLGACSGCNLTTGSNNVSIGFNTALPSATGSCQLSIGFSPTDSWLTGDSTKAIKPGAGIIDCAGSCGTSGQVLMSNGTNAICWGTVGGGSPATPTVAGLLPGCDNSTNGITAVGSNALLSLTTGTENIAIGLNAGCSLTTGFSNIAVGACALCSVIDTTENTAIGDLALWKTTGDSNTAVGSRAGKCVTVGYGNTAVGRSALEFTCGGDYNSGVGVSALRNACGNYNTALGYQAGYRSDGDNNVFIGADSGAQVLTGAWNTFLGYNSGFSVVSGCNNVLIGTNIDPGTDVSDCLMIGTGGIVPFTWLTGDSTGAVKPSAGVIDCAGSCGTAGQVLMSNGANAVCWGTAGGGGGSPATPTAAGIVLGCTTATNTALGCNALLSTTGGGNIALGQNAGCSLTTETCNVIVGGYAGSVGESNAVSLSDGAGNLKLHVGQFGGWSVGGGTGNVGSSGQVLTSAGSFGAPSWTTIPKFQTSSMSSNLGPGGAGAVVNAFGPSLNSWNYNSIIVVTLKIIDTVTSTQYNYSYNGTMYADGSTPWTMSQLASKVLDNTGGRLTFLLDYDTGYQYKPRLTITYVSGNLMTVTGNIQWINLAGDYA